METREFFKKLVAEAQEKDIEKCETVLGTHGHKRLAWFKGGKYPGKYANLTNEEIDTMPEKLLHDRMILFIATHFQQR